MKHTNEKFKLILKLTRKSLLLAAIAVFLSGAVNAQTTLFSFQGKLPNEAAPASDIFEMEFRLFDAATGGTQIGATNTVGEIAVKNRSFTVWLDFGAAAFPGADRFIEISYRRSGGNQPFAIVFPREQVLSVPYSIRSLAATTADNALSLNGLDVSNFVQTNDSRLSDERNPLPGSNNYIQNTTVRQSPANFNISGTGAANVLNAAAQYNLGGQRFLSSSGGNLSVGFNTNILNSGLFNTFLGFNAGMSNSGGSQNTFVGNGAGKNNSVGRRNTFVGNGAGDDNTSGQENSFFGSFAGTGSIGSNNTFIGESAGFTTDGSENTFVGRGAGVNATRGTGNTFIGDLSGLSAGGGVPSLNNTLLGSNTKVAANVSNSTALGAGATVSTSNTIVIGTANQTTFIPGGGVSTFNDGFSGIIADNLIFRHLGRDIPASSSPLCFRITSVQTPVGSDVGNGLTSCSSSSSLVFKTDVKPFTNGLDVIKLLKPVAFRWKSDGIGDVGLNTEDVTAVVPQLVRSGGKGEVGDINRFLSTLSKSSRYRLKRRKSKFKRSANKSNGSSRKLTRSKNSSVKQTRKPRCVKRKTAYLTACPFGVRFKR
jgi:hypothetical protein